MAPRRGFEDSTKTCPGASPPSRESWILIASSTTALGGQAIQSKTIIRLAEFGALDFELSKERRREALFVRNVHAVAPHTSRLRRLDAWKPATSQIGGVYTRAEGLPAHS